MDGGQRWATIHPDHTEISLAAMIAPVARACDESESLNSFKLMDAGD
jgi:hypothetical protein